MAEYEVFIPDLLMLTKIKGGTLLEKVNLMIENVSIQPADIERTSALRGYFITTSHEDVLWKLEKFFDVKLSYKTGEVV